MKTFEDFIATKKFMNAKEFGEQTSQDIDISGVSNVYVYKDYYYIDIYDNKSIGFPSQTKKYGLIICNEYHESDNLEELEIKLYNDWFIDNLEGSEEWLYKVGYHTPKQTSLYFKMFRDMHLNVEDITYSNDIVDTLRLSWGTLPICDVLLPNSAKQNLEEEKFDTFSLIFLDKDGERIDGDVARNDMCESVDELEEALVDYFHQIARNFMDEMVDLCKLNVGNPMSLDEFLFEYKDKLNSTFGNNYNVGKNIESLHDNFKHLEDWYKFGCEPKQMFDYEHCPIATFEEVRTIKNKSVSKWLNDDAKREFEECQSIVSVNRGGHPIDLSGNAYMDDNDNMVCNRCGNIVMSS